MATNKAICKAATDFDEAQSQLQSLKDRKQKVSDELAALNQRITDQQVIVLAFLTTLKTMVNE